MARVPASGRHWHACIWLVTPAGRGFHARQHSIKRADINKEIDRYITWPAQALSYKIGELKIRELRASAESELGSSFDIRRFHDMVVGNGSLPIAVLGRYGGRLD